jgi:uncharacterized membrane protein YhaH (DUF805 family)
MGWMMLALSRYFDLKGRSRRREYWMFVLLVVAVVLLAGMLMIISKGSFRTQGEMASTFSVWAGLAIARKRPPITVELSG